MRTDDETAKEQHERRGWDRAIELCANIAHGESFMSMPDDEKLQIEHRLALKITDEIEALTYDKDFADGTEEESADRRGIDGNPK